MARYIQKISLRPYSETEIWTGWELEGREGPIDGLVLAETLSEEELAGNREDMWQSFLSRETDDSYYRERSADLSKVEVPLLTAANWGGTYASVVLRGWSGA